MDHRFHSCSVCSLGLVSVPHIKTIKDGQWEPPYYTMVVTCECSDGDGRFNAFNQKLREHSERNDGPRIRIMDLKSYEFEVPNWREMLAEREEMKRQRNRSLPGR